MSTAAPSLFPAVVKRARHAAADPDWPALAAELRARGVVVAPLAGAESLCAAARRARAEFIEYVPEKVRAEDAQQVLGGFGALGNPSSFHHPAVRALRGAVKDRVAAPLLREFVAGDPQPQPQPQPWRLEALFDRLCVRHVRFGKPQREAWHRDQYDPDRYTGPFEPPCRALLPGDLVLGGWINCNETSAPAGEDQWFSCVPGTHLEDAAPGGGFRPLRDAGAYAARAEKVRVPPGCVVLFFQGLVHEVAPVACGKTAPPSVRLFVGHRLTADDKPLFDGQLQQWVSLQAVPRIPSGQRPPMYSPMHYTSDKLRNWAATMFRREFLRAHPRAGYAVPAAFSQSRAMDSLAAYGQGMWPEYREDELRVLCPEPLQ